MTATKPPAPRRLSRPRWLDVRVVGGVLLLVVSIALGAKVVGSATRTVPVWVLARDLTAGTVIAGGDLVAEDLHLAGVAGAYLAASSSPAGKVLNRDVRAGELLPAAAVRPVGDARVLSVAVAAERMAPGVTHGSHIDLYLVSGRAAVGDEVRTSLLLSDVTVQSVTAPASGGLSGAVSNRFQVALLLEPAAARDLVGQLALGDALIVARTSAVVLGDEGAR